MHTGKGACDAMRGLLSRDPAFRRFRGIMDMGKTPDDPHVYITTVRENMHVFRCVSSPMNGTYAVKRLFNFVSRDKRIRAGKHQITTEAEYEQ